MVIIDAAMRNSGERDGDSGRTAHIAALGFSDPPLVTTSESFREWTNARLRELKLDTSASGKDLTGTITRMAEGSGIKHRHLICSPAPRKVDPATTTSIPVDDPETNIYTKENDFNPDQSTRAHVYRKYVGVMAIEAAQNALREWGGDPSAITDVIGVTTSGWTEPGIACQLIYGLGLHADTTKIELVFNGCFCGMTGLRMARELVLAKPGRTVLVCAVEVGSTNLNAMHNELSMLLANNLFGDGAAAAIVSERGAWEMHGFAMHTLPRSAHMLAMSYSAPEYRAFQGYQMTLNRGLADALKEAVLGRFGVRLARDYLYNCGLSRPAFAIHPGGAKILDFVRGALRAVRLLDKEDTSMDASYEALREHGNQATVSIFNVLRRLLPATPKDRVACMAFGPGVTIEYGFLRRAGST